MQDVCRQAGSDEALIEQVGRANTGRHFLELCQEAGDMRPVQVATEIAQRNLEQFMQEKGRMDLPVDCILIDFNRPNVLAQKLSELTPPAVVGAAGRTLIERFAENPADAYEDDEDGRHIKA